MNLARLTNAFLEFAFRKRMLTAVIAGTAALLVFLGIQVSHRIDLMRAAPQDNVQWALAQIDVELLALAVALRDAESGREPAIPEVRKRFDIFYGRVATVRALPAFFLEPEEGKARSVFGVMQATLDSMLARLNGDDAAVVAQVPALIAAADSLRPLARQISLDGVRIHSLLSDNARNDLADLFRLTAATDLILIGLLLVALLLLARQFRISRASAEALRVVSERTANTIRASFDPIIVTDFAGRIVEFNPAAERTFGISVEEAMGRDMADLIIPAHLRESCRQKMSRFRKMGALKAVEEGPFEMPAVRRDGTEFPAEMSITTSDRNGGNHIVTFLRDMTTRREQEKALHQARDDALETARMKSHFLAVMSHEMRTPLNGVMAIMDLLAETKLTDKQKEYLHTALTAAEVLKQHVDDVLDLTRIQAGKIELLRQPFDLRVLLEEVCRINAPVAATRGNRVRPAIGMKDTYFTGDRKRIHQILTNLVGNAVKFTKDGKITVAASIVEDSPGASSGTRMVELSVQDTGSGVAPGIQKKIFEEFVTIGPASIGNTSGTGLGLSICKSLAEAMGGSIGLDSELGKGSRFHVRIPLQLALRDEIVEAPRPQPRPARLKPDSRLHVLVVEDNATNRFVVAEMLRKLNCDVSQANGGKAGISLANRKRFDLILMDISMPGINGWDASKAIRASRRGKSRNTPIYALTAHVLSEEMSVNGDACMQGYIYKPLRLKTLTAVLDLLRSGGLKAIQAPREAAADTSGHVDREAVADLRELFSASELRARLDHYVAEARSGLAELKSMSRPEEDGDRAALAHKLAGSASVVGAKVVRNLLLELETEVKSYRGRKLSAHLRKLDDSVSRFSDEAARLINEPQSGPPAPVQMSATVH